jgi:acetolactate synthase-1/2/3 large subunit
VDFVKKDGGVYSPRFDEVGRAFGLAHSERVEDPFEVGRAVQRALASDGPALVEVMVAREFPEAGLIKTGWWDVPVPEWHAQQRAAYQAGRGEEQHT